MKKLLLMALIIFTTGCSYTHINGYNLHTYENDIYKEYFIHESISFLKVQQPPAHRKIVFIDIKDDGFSTLFVNRLRSTGYAISEITLEELEVFNAKKNEFKFSYSIDYVYERTKDTQVYYISLQLFVNDYIYSKIYVTNSLSELPQPLGSWSAKEVIEDRI